MSRSTRADGSRPPLLGAREHPRGQAAAVPLTSEELYRALFDNLMSGLAYCRLVFDGERPVDWVYLAVNPAFETLVGFRDVVGKKVSELVPGVLEADPEFFELCGRVVRSGIPERHEIYIRSMRFWADVVVYSLGEDCFVTLFDVITERKEAEAVLRHQLELQDQDAKIAATVPGMIYSFRLRPDGSAGLPFSTAAVEDLWGFRPEELHDDFSPAFARIHPDDLARVQEGIAESAKTLSPWFDSFRVLHPQKGEIWLEGHSLPRAEADGGVLWHGFVQDVTTRKQAEEASQELGSKLQAALASTGDAIVITDVEDRSVEFNEAFAKFYRFKNKEECPRTPPEFHALVELLDGGAPMPLEQWPAHRALRGESGMNAEYTLRRRDTGATWVGSYSYAPVRDKGGVIIGAIATARDITEQKRAEEALRFAEFSIDKAIDLIYWLDAKGRIAYVNDAICARTGYTREELLAMTLSDLDPRAPRPWLFDEGKRRSAMRIETTHRSKSGEFFDVEIRGSYVQHGDKEYLCVYGREITERKAAEAALRDSEERFRAVVERAPDGVFLEREGRFEYANPAMAQILGAERPEDLIGTEVMDRIAPEYREAVLDRRSSQEKTGEILPAVNRDYLRLDGSRIPVESSGVLLQFQEGPARLVFVRDLTEHQKAEADRENLQEQLLQAQKMESVGRLAGGVAHDFNNILMVQKGYCELMRLALREGDPLTEDLDQIETYADRAAGLTRQLLAFSRKQTLLPAVLDLNLLATDLEDMLGRLIGEDVDLVIIPAPEPALVLADRGQIEQVLANLSVNARDAMPEGGRLSIEVSFVELPDTSGRFYTDLAPGRYVKLAVVDTGCGMDSETRSRIFEPFFTTKAEGKGTGLGLSTAYGIVRQSGGDIWVDSQLGVGTEFEICLPRVHAGAAQPAGEGAEVTRGQEELVLVVEDEPALRKLAVLMLERLGYRTAEAADGDTALAQVENEGLRPDLLLTDVVIPGMSGRLLIERLRATLPQIKLIYMSGYTDDTIAHHGVLDSGVNFLQKPFSMADLARAVRSGLTG